MKRTRTYMAAIAISILSAMSATTSAKTPIYEFGTGSETGNYYQMAKDVIDYCGPEISDAEFNVVSTTGSDENLLGLSEKRFSMANIQEDALNYYADRNNRISRTSLSVITPLHSEAFHLFIPRNYKPEKDSGSWLSNLMGGDEKPKKLSLSLLKGQVLGSYGGGLTSSRALSDFFNLDLRITKTSAEEILAGGFNEPVLLVSGQPFEMAKKMLKTNNWVLMPLNYDEISSKHKFYGSTELTYEILGQTRTIPTISVRSLMVAKRLRRDSRNEPMRQLSKCIYESLPDLDDDSMTNPNWQSVYNFVINEDGQADWPSFKID